MHISDKFRRSRISVWTKLTVAGFLLSIIAVLYLNAHPQTVLHLRNYGILGFCTAILAMTVFCLTPVPSESLLFVLLKVYGIMWGVLGGWTGLLLSNVIIFFVVRRMGARWLPQRAYPQWFQASQRIVVNTGRRGLLISRLLPIPAFFSSIILAFMPVVGFFDYLWTSGISVIPYYTGMIFIFKGLTGAVLVWLPVGLCFLLGVSLAGSAVLKRRKTGAN